MPVYHYTIADIPLSVTLPFPLQITRESEPFLTDSCNPADTVTFTQTDHLPPVPPDSHCTDSRYYCTFHITPAVYRCLYPDTQPYALVTYSPYKIHVQYTPEAPAHIPETFYLLNLLGLEQILLRHSALILHASFIRWNDCGILFSAPSGTGKSTQADLWQRFQNAEILNGDRAGLRQKNGIWHAYGLPYAGSSGIYRNESAPLTTIVILGQAKENRIRRLSPVEALRCMLPEFTLHRWDSVFMEQALDLISSILSAVPVYRLDCLPDRSAVELLRNTITKEILS